MDPNIGPLELAEMIADTPPAACIRIDTTSEAYDFAKEIELRNQPWNCNQDGDLVDVCTMVYTAADDGFAKAAMLTHDNMVADAKGVGHAVNPGSGTISCGLGNFQHLYPLQVGVIAPFLFKGDIYIDELATITNVSSIAANIERLGVTHLYTIPAIYYLLSKVNTIFKKAKPLRNVVSGGYKLSEDIFRRFLKATGKEIHEGYGLTEGAPVCTWTYDRVKPQSVGVSFSCCEIRVFSESGSAVESGNTGEIRIKGTNIMKGYYRRQHATHLAFADGWLRTGDIGYLDTDGYVYLTGMIKKMINYGGKKVYPAEVERLVRTNENVDDIEVFGVEDKLFGQSVCAKIRLKENTPAAREELLAWCRGALSKYKVFSKAVFE
jgi:acyl-CoA synthetase (AMP-forming)/AMP-acid ligase II